MRRISEFTILERGEQVAYVPPHALGYLGHPDVEIGFVTSLGMGGDIAFCRFWSKAEPMELRTRANSEAVPIDLLAHPNYDQLRPQGLVDRLLHEIRTGERE